MALKDYVPAMKRHAQFRADYKDKKVFIDFEYDLNWEKECAKITAIIYVDGEKVAKASTVAPSLGEDKEFEKAETGAVGRALAFLGYEASDEDVDASSDDDEDKPRKGLGSKKKKSSKKTKKAKDEEEQSEEESEEEEETDDDESEEEGESEDDDDDEEEEKESDDKDKKEAKKSEDKPAAGKSALNSIMGKYGLNKDKKKDE